MRNGPRITLPFLDVSIPLQPPQLDVGKCTVLHGARLHGQLGKIPKHLFAGVGQQLTNVRLPKFPDDL
jgi:hypothetical protein